VWDSEPVCGTAMRVIATFSSPCAADALTAHVSVFSYNFKGLERLPKLATSYHKEIAFMLAHAGSKPSMSSSGCGMIQDKHGPARATEQAALPLQDFS
jgi:hypothetical protein